MTARELLRRFPNAGAAFVAANAEPVSGRADEPVTAAPKQAITEPVRPKFEPQTAGTPVVDSGTAKANAGLLRRFTVVLPLPPKVLRANGRTRNHAFLASEIKRYRKIAMLAGLAALKVCHQPMLKRASIQVKWCRAAGPALDPTNVTRGKGIKAAEDGLTDAGFWASDRFVEPLQPLQECCRKNPRVELHITEL